MSLLEIPVDYLEARIIELLNEVKPPVNRREVLSRLAAEGLSIPESKLYKIFSYIRNRWKLVAQVNMYALGLRDLVVVLKKVPENIYTPYLVFQSQLRGRGLVLSYRLPFKVPASEILSYYPRELVEDYIVVVYKRRPGPALMKYYFDGWIRVNLLTEISKVFDRLRGLDDVVIDKSLKRFSLTDLLIVSELERDALSSVRDIARKINAKYDRVLRRVESIRKQGIVEGIGVGLFDLELLRRGARLIVIGGLRGAYPYHRLTMELARIPGLGTVGVDTLTDKILLLIPSRHVEYNNLANSLKRHLVNVKIYEVEPEHSVFYRIPRTLRTSIQEYIGTWFEFTTESRIT